MTLIRHIIDGAIILTVVISGIADLVYSFPIDAKLLEHTQHFMADIRSSISTRVCMAASIARNDERIDVEHTLG